MSALIEHLEEYLGIIDVGWSKDADGGSVPFQVARFGHPLGPESVAFATLGLSSHELHSSRSGQPIRHELVMLLAGSQADGPAPGLLQQVGRLTLDRHHALLRGDVVGPAGPLVSGSQMEALYAAIPSYLPDEFAVCDVDGNPVAMVWLVPIAAREAEFIAREGWEEFENRLTELQPDLLDPFRRPLTLEP